VIRIPHELGLRFVGSKKRKRGELVDFADLGKLGSSTNTSATLLK
jgi:hypothetical protein